MPGAEWGAEVGVGLVSGVRGWMDSHRAAAAAGARPVGGPAGVSTLALGKVELAPDMAGAADLDAPMGGSVWPDDRLAVVEALWGEGFIGPGGEDEALRLARPLGLTAAASLMLLGAGPGGAARAIATKLGVWVTGFEADARLAAVAAARSVRAGLARRAPVERWDPAEPSFKRQSHHHAVALEPLRGAPPEPVLAAIRQALKPGGQIMLTELVAEPAFDRTDPLAADWARLEGREPSLPTQATVTRTLGRLGFDVRVVEDVSDRHAQLAAQGWRRLLATIDEKPSPEHAALTVQQAELWLLRLRLIRQHKMRLIRWHAIGTVASGAPVA